MMGRLAIFLLPLVLCGCLLQDPGFLPQKCQVEDRFSCEAAFGEQLRVTLFNEGASLESVEIQASGDCYDQVVLGPLLENASDSAVLCASQVLDDRVALTLLLSFEEDGVEREVEGVLRAVRG